jgi:anti-sigma regulatory factor (Ser/Thr protein kinase)
MKIVVENRLMMKSALFALCEFLSERGVAPERVFDSKLIASELVGNVFTHSTGKASVFVRVDGEFVEMEFSSTTPFVFPKKTELVETLAEHGRGLYLVDTLCFERLQTENGAIIVRIKRK